MEKTKDEYVEHMFGVSANGDLREWIAFFLEADNIVRPAVPTAARLQDLHPNDRESLQVAKRSALLLRIVDLAFEKPALSFADVARTSNVTYRSARDNINILTDAGLVRDTPSSYPKIIYFPQIIDVVQED